jgi:hypothetical protein
VTILGPDREPFLDDEPLAPPADTGPQPEPEPEPEPETQPEPPPKGWNRRGLLGAVLGLAAVGATLIGSFLKLCTAQLSFGASPQEVLTVTSWRVDPSTQFDPLLAVSNGIPLVFGAVLVGFGAVAALFAAPPSAPLAMRRLARVLVAIGAAFLAGSVWTVGMQVSSMVDSFESLGRDEGFRGLTVSAEVGSGFWLLLGAALAAIVAMVLTLLPPSAGRRAKRAAAAGGGAIVWQLEDEDTQERVEPPTPGEAFPMLDEPLDLPQPYSPEHTP